MPVKRIASLLASGTEILYALGLGDRVVAVSHECDHPTEVAAKPRVTVANIDATATSRDIDEQVRTLSTAKAALYGIDVECLTDLAPDLIITQAQCEVCAVNYADVVSVVDTHDALKGTEIVALNPTTLTTILDDIHRVALAAPCSDAGHQFIQSLQARIEHVRSRTAGLAPADRPRVVCIEWIEPVMVAANWLPEMVQIAGGDYQLAQPGASSAYGNWADVISYDPQVIVVMPCGFDLERTIVEATALCAVPHFADLAAVRDERVFAVDANAYFTRPGPRTIDSLEFLAQMIHPPIFGEPASDAPLRRL